LITNHKITYGFSSDYNIMRINGFNKQEEMREIIESYVSNDFSDFVGIYIQSDINWVGNNIDVQDYSSQMGRVAFMLNDTHGHKLCKNNNGNVIINGSDDIYVFQKYESGKFNNVDYILHEDDINAEKNVKIIFSEWNAKKKFNMTENSRN
jgi:hypothetical protein